MILILKGGGGGSILEVLGLIGVLLKMVALILNFHMGVAIAFNNMLHSFRYGHGMGTASLEAKILW